ncbi:hypothetical protein POF50_033230 [Streptomyces sp. SL13]|uniref:Uncharacterized protein n=1 Tax=Streptantibioticus silvisoli TaxID=2705255 RepID=A0AA90HB73_9ACTN|nr:hypothetical protein [Streptantibioticus silvisoli]MDI5964121.1 hypothetical protein [Streptantibioticus silvisoli]MDI5974153.1 hypothetical protein [Streptantibioticus silvisoli]
MIFHMTPGNVRVTTGAPPGRISRAATLSWTWLRRNIDTAVTLAAAVIISILGLASTIAPDMLESAILGVLALLAIVAIRDRDRIDARDEATAEAAERTSRSMARVSEDLQFVRGFLEAGPEIQVLHGEEIERGLAAARDGAPNWLFRGGIGTYFRTVTLPQVVEQARSGSRSLSLRLEILDPADEVACGRYLRHRQSQANSGELWNRRQVERECFATVLACCWYRKRYPRLRVEIGLSRTVRAMQYDLSDDALFITQEPPLRPALKAPSGRELYAYARTELDISFDEARPVDLELVRDVPIDTGNGGPTHNEVRRLFTTLRLPLPAAYGDADIADIVRRALHHENANP